MELLNKLDQIQNLGWWERLTGWKGVIDTLSKMRYMAITLKNEANLKERSLFEEQTKLASITEARNRLETKLALIEEEDRHRTVNHEKALLVLKEVQRGLEEDRHNLRKHYESNLKRESEKMREAWRIHESEVEAEIRTICKRYNVEYILQSDVPFKGKPDNTVLIGGSYTIFDAKSPATTSLEIFSRYVKTQAEAQKKYTKDSSVNNTIFLVVPSNTIDVLQEFTYEIGTYTVHVIPVQALEPIICSLKRIEDFELTEELDPEVRDNMFKIMGKLVHDVKRGVQINNNVASYLLGSISNIKMLPPSMVTQIEEQEKAEKYNPPQEQRKKLIDDNALAEDIEFIDNSVK